MGINQLAFWSIVALTARVIALILLLIVSRRQWVELRIKTKLQPFKKRLFSLVAVIIVTNIPIMYLHYERIVGNAPSAAATSFATVTNAIGMLIFGVLWYLVYQTKVSD